MEPIADLTTLRTILQSLRGKGLVIEVTPAGRGQIISHALYEPQEIERLKERHAGAAGGEEFEAARAEPSAAHRQPANLSHGAASSNAGVASSGGSTRELESLRAELAELRQELAALADAVKRQEGTISDLRSSLGG